MADNNNSQGFDLLGVLRKFFSLIDKTFTILDKQYAEDGSSKFIVKLENGDTITITCVPSKTTGLMNAKFQTDSTNILEGTDNPVVKKDIKIQDIRDAIIEVGRYWYGEGFDQEEEHVEGEIVEDSDESDNIIDSTGEEIEESERFLRFGLSRITGSNELKLTKIYANYDTSSALEDFQLIVDDPMFDDIEDEQYFAVDCEGEDFEVYNTGDFDLDYADMLYESLSWLYEIQISGKVLKKIITDTELQKFFSIDSTVSSIIDYIEGLIIDYTGKLESPLCYLRLGECDYCSCIGDCDYSDCDKLCDLYCTNLDGFCSDIRFYMCNFDADTQNVFNSYVNTIEQYLDSVCECEEVCPTCEITNE